MSDLPTTPTAKTSNTLTNYTSKRILRIKELSSMLGLSRSTIYDKLDTKSPRFDPTFPKPIKLGLKAVGWIEGAIDEWLLSRMP